MMDGERDATRVPLSVWSANRRGPLLDGQLSEGLATSVLPFGWSAIYADPLDRETQQGSVGLLWDTDGDDLLSRECAGHVPRFVTVTVILLVLTHV